MAGWKLKRTRQCEKCPWRKATDPREIPDGYSEFEHAALAATIAEPGAISFDESIRAMACHETADAHCLGWLMNQLGPGNNIALRLQVMSCTNLNRVRLQGEQHETFADTLPSNETVRGSDDARAS